MYFLTMVVKLAIHKDIRNGQGRNFQTQNRQETNIDLKNILTAALARKEN